MSKAQIIAGVFMSIVAVALIINQAVNNFGFNF